MVQMVIVSAYLEQKLKLVWLSCKINIAPEMILLQ